MTAGSDLTEQLSRRVADAYGQQTPLAIQAGRSKHFLGERVEADPLDVAGHRGIVRYEPGELVMTARAGTPLVEIEKALAAEQQILAFEPPHYGDDATLGGTIAAGVSGPARPFTGAARDFVLGTRVINGRGEVLRFGGDVMKNVAGYDLSRLMAGAHGTLGVLLDISLKVLPAPHAQTTLVFEHAPANAIEQMNRWLRKPWPITGAYWEDGCTYLRLAGAQSSVDAARAKLGGEAISKDREFWRGVREHRGTFFADERPLWRVSVAPATPALDIDGDTAIDWGGAQRWLLSDADSENLRATVEEYGGHASVYHGQISPRFHPLSPPMVALHRRLKQSMDPAGILNRGRLYSDF